MATAATTTSVKARRPTLKLGLFIIALLLVIPPAMFFFRPGIFVAQAQRYRAWKMGLHDGSVMLDGQKIHYLAGGNGKPLVLVHGLAGRAEDWFALMPDLMRSGYRVYAPDLLGFGRSARPDIDYSIARQEELVRQFMDSQRLQQADIAGWSMGGWISLKFAADHPDRVHRLILLDSAGLKFDAVNAPLLRPKTEADLDRMMQALTPHPPHIPGFYARDLLRNFAQEDWIIDRALKSMYAGHDLLDGRLNTVHLPVLIVWGKQDVLTPPSIAEQMHQAMPQSVLQIFDGCGHLAPVECKDEVAKSMIDFLAAGAPPKSGAQAGQGTK